jgi:hypothetical protein
MIAASVALDPGSETARAGRALRRGSPCVAALALLALAAPARADESSAARRATAARERDRPYTMVELGGGLMTLPTADVCPNSPTSCEQGETSVSVGIHNLYRLRDIGFGAGILWASTLSAESARGARSLGRDHSRRYFLVEGQFRYYGIRTSTWEWWGGGTLGGVVVNDFWTVKADREPYTDTAFVGPGAAIIGTEGLATGLAIGGEWTFTANWSFGTQLRYSVWFLPDEPERSPTGDYASLSGRVDMFNVGLLIAYRVAL